MYSTSDAPEVEVRPDVVFLAELLRELTQGALRIPRFQRPFVWRNDQMTDLLDSVREQYPIGSLLVWETDLPIAALKRLGPFVFPQTNQASVGYLLDGHQRLSTLAGALIAPDSAPGDVEDSNRWNLSWNMEARRFQHGKSSIHDPKLFPTTALLDTLRFFDEVDLVRNRWSHDPLKAGRFVTEVSRLAQSFQHYRVPVIRIKRTGLSEAVEIFARLNSRGQAMTADQMVGALLYREGEGAEFDLASEIDSLSELLARKNFGDVDRTTILRAILANLGEDIYKTDWTRFTKERRDAVLGRMRTAIERTEESLDAATDFLCAEGIRTTRLLPYSIQLVLLSAFFDKNKMPSHRQRFFLRRFLWASSFSGWFSGANPTQVNGMVRELRSIASTEDFHQELTSFDVNAHALPFPSNFDMRSARTRCVVSMMLDLRPLSADGAAIVEPWREIAEKGPNAMGRIFANVPRPVLSNAANRMLRPPGEERSYLAPWLLEVARRGLTDVLESHAVSDEAIRALEDGRPEDFVRARQATLISVERHFQASLKLSASSDLAGANPIDTE